MTLVEAKQLWTAKDTAKHLKIGLTKTYNLIATGKIPSVRIGNSRRVIPEQLEARIKEWQEEQEGNSSYFD